MTQRNVLRRLDWGKKITLQIGSIDVAKQVIRGALISHVAGIDQVFGQNGKPIQSICRNWRTARTTAGMHDFGIHDLRGTFVN